MPPSKPDQSPKLLSLFVRYGPGSHGRADAAISSVEDLHQLYRERFPIAISSVIIDNALPPEVGPQDLGTHWVIPGDNTYSEFSAWDRGLAFAEEAGLTWDVVNLVTSTFNSLYSGYLRFVDERVVRLVAGREVCVGHLDAYNEPVTLFGFQSQSWVRTSYWFLSRESVEKVGSLVSITDVSALFADSDQALFRDEAPLSDNYKEFLLHWITGRDIGQGRRWHSTLAVTPEQIPDAQRKVHAILNEHLLSIRLRQAGVRTLDAIWLGYNLRGVIAPLALEGWNPSWQHQLAERPVDALVFNGSGSVHVEDRWLPARGWL